MQSLEDGEKIALCTETLERLDAIIGHELDDTGKMQKSFCIYTQTHVKVKIIVPKGGRPHERRKRKIFDHEPGCPDFGQAGERFRSLSKMDQEHLADNLVSDLMHIDKPILQRVIDNLTKADPELGRYVAEGLKR